jgi:hypothetical protein
MTLLLIPFVPMRFDTNNAAPLIGIVSIVTIQSSDTAMKKCQDIYQSSRRFAVMMMPLPITHPSAKKDPTQHHIHSSPSLLFQHNVKYH